MEKSTFNLIRQYDQEVNNHHRAGTYNIWAYYHEPQVTEYKNAPHDQQFKQAAAYIDIAITKVGTPGNEWENRKESIEWLSRRDWSRHMAADLLYGVALELIVSSVHLKLDTLNYVTNMAKTGGKTPRISVSRTRLAEDLRHDIPNSHLKEIEATLDLAKTKRNNLAHFGHHYHGGPNFSMLFVTVAGYLIDRYADTNEIPELQRMAEYLDELDRERVESEVYPELSVDFRPVK